MGPNLSVCTEWQVLPNQGRQTQQEARRWLQVALGEMLSVAWFIEAHFSPTADDLRFVRPNAKVITVPHEIMAEWAEHRVQ
jgi:hypothetical protein